MGRKHDVKTEVLHSTLYEDDKNKECGYDISINMECAFGKVICFNVHKLDWGSAAREWYGHDLWVDIIISDKLALQKLTSKFQARTPEQLIEKMTERFTPCGESSFDEIKDFLDKKGIPYDYNVQ